MKSEDPSEPAADSTGPPADPSLSATLVSPNSSPVTTANPVAATVASQRDAWPLTVNPHAETVAHAATHSSESAHTAFPRELHDRYERIGELARGGMGRIVTARDRYLDRSVALKELLEHDSHSAARFEREARITARLQHPAIVPVYEAAVTSSGEPFFAMKLLDGKPLGEVIASKSSLPERLALLPHVIAISEAIAFAHSRDVIHRDLKPANVLVGAFGETVVIDWGIARDTTRHSHDDVDTTPYRTSSGGLTMAGAVMGTPAYMPPEQARGENVDARADVYALGTILYELLAGRAPYEGTNPWGVLSAVLAGPPPALHEIDANIPVELCAIVDRAMAREPSERYATAGDLVRDLRHFEAGQLVGAHRYTAGALFRRWLRKHRAAATASVLAVIAIAGVTVASFDRVAEQRNIAVAEMHRADSARRQAEDARKRAFDAANGAALARAHEALESDPARAIAVLQGLAPEGDGWGIARLLAGAALRHGVPLHVWMPTREFVRSLAWSPEGNRLAVLHDGDRLVVWDLRAGAHRAVTLESRSGSREPWVGLAFGADGRELLVWHSPLSTSAFDTAVRIDVQNGTSTVLEGAAARTALVPVLPDARIDRGFAPDQDRTIHRVFDPTSGTWRVGTGRLGGAHDASVDGTRMLEAFVLPQNRGLGLRLWSLTANPPAPITPTRAVGEGSDLTLSPDAQWVFANSVNATNPRPLLNLVTGESFEWSVNQFANPAFSPDGSIIAATGAERSTIDLVYLQGTDRTPTTIGFTRDVVTEPTFSHDRRLLAVGLSGGQVALLHAPRGRSPGSRVVAIFRGHNARYVRMAFSPDSSLLAVGLADGSVRVWDVNPDHQSQHFDPLPGAALAVRTREDGMLAMVARTSPSTLTSLRVRDGQVVASVPLQTAPGFAASEVAHDDGTASLSPDASQFVYIDEEFVARAWNTETGEQTAEFANAHVVAITNDGHNLVSASGRTVSVRALARGPGSNVREWTLPQTTTIPLASGVSREVLEHCDSGWIDAVRPAIGAIVFLSLRCGPDSSPLVVRFDGATGEQHAMFRTSSPFRLSDDGRTLVAIDAPGRLGVWDVSSAQRTEVPLPFDHRATPLHVLRSGDSDVRVLLASASEVIVVRRSDRSVQRWPLAHRNTIAGEISPDETRLVTVHSNGLTLYDLRTGEFVDLAPPGRRWLVDGAVFSEFSRDGNDLWLVEGGSLFRVRDALPTATSELRRWLDQQPFRSSAMGGLTRLARFATDPFVFDSREP